MKQVFNGTKRGSALKDRIDIFMCVLTVAIVFWGTCVFADYMGILRYFLLVFP